MPAQKTLERLVEREERKQRARVRQHHHKAGERPHAVADPDRAEGAPVDLRLFARQRRQAAIDRGRRRGPQRADDAPQLDDRAGVAARAHHLEEPRRAQARILRQRVADERADTDRASSRGTCRAARACVSCAIAARTVSWWTPRAAAMVPTFQCSPK